MNEAKMLGRHQSQLMLILEEVSERGWSFIDWWKMYRWYGVKKIRKEPYRDIKDRWEEMTGGDELYVVEMNPWGLLLMNREPTEISKKV